MKSTGTDKKGKLLSHFTSAHHKDALMAYVNFCDPYCHVDVMFDISKRKIKIQEEDDRLENVNVVKILFDICRTLARQDIAFRGDGKLEIDGNFNQIVQLIARHCPILKGWLNNRNGRAHSLTYMSNQSQNEMIKLL